MEDSNSMARYGELSTDFPIVLDDVDCSSSTYLTILQCRYSTFIDSNCDRGVDDVSVICITTRIWNSPYDLQIRLSGALYTNQGLVEVYCNGQWGTVCDDSFGLTDANTVCRQLGYTGAARYDRLTTLQGTTGQPIWLDDVLCRSSSYSCLRSCQRCPSTQNHNCQHSEDVTVECEYRSGSSVSNMVSTCDFGSTSGNIGNGQTIVNNTIPRRGTVRLVRNNFTSPSYTSGRVQIYITRWGQICDDSQFSISEATVICHQLGFSGASSFSRAAVDTFGELSTDFPIVLDEVDCSTSTYLTILQCRYSTFIYSNCDRGVDDVSVICFTTRIWSSPYDLQIRLSGALYTNQGLVEVYCNGQWGTVCHQGFGSIVANTVCRQLGYTGAAQYDQLTLQGTTGQPIWLDNVLCRSSSYSCLRSCQRCPSTQIHNCEHSEDITVECEYRSGSFVSVSTRVSTCDFGTELDAGALVGGLLGGCVIPGAIVTTIIVILSVYACYTGKCCCQCCRHCYGTDIDDVRRLIAMARANEHAENQQAQSCPYQPPPEFLIAKKSAVPAQTGSYLPPPEFLIAQKSVPVSNAALRPASHHLPPVLPNPSMTEIRPTAPVPVTDDPPPSYDLHSKQDD